MAEHAPVKITVDSTCDLTPELYEKFGIIQTPLYVTLGDKDYRDGVDIFQKDVFAYVEDTGELPKTAAVPIADYASVFCCWREKGYEVVHINISQKMSASHQNALHAAQKAGGVYVVDSANLSTGSGHLALMGAELAQKGLSAAEIYEELQRAAMRVEASFVVDKLEYLHKGGRCSSVARLGANLLKLKPCIQVKNGEMGVAKKYRGSLELCLTQYVKEQLEGRTDLDPHRIFITHTVQDKKLVASVKKQVEALGIFEEICVTGAGCTISSHCGPGTLGVLFLHREK